MNILVKTLFLLMATVSVAHAAGDAAAGKDKVMMCSACHGADGNSVVGTFPKLAGQGEKYLIKQLKDVQSGARQIVAMTGMLDNMTEQDFADIAAYYAAQTQTPGVAQDELLDLGERIFRAGNSETGVAACSGCHSPRAIGNAPGGFPRLAGQHAEYLASTLKAYQTETRANDGDSKIMRGVAARLSDKEIKAVANYIAGLR
jgi:cytochrome c553